MTEADSTSSMANHERWCRAPSTALERSPVPYGWLVLAVVLLGAIGQGVEFWLRDPGWVQMRRNVTEGLAFVGVLAFTATHLRFAKLATARGLAALRPAVAVSDADYEAHVHRALYGRGRVEATLLGVSVLITLALFLSPPRDLLAAAAGRPASALLIAYLIATYVVQGWLLLTLIYTAIRSVIGLGALARCPLGVNVFDTANLAPFSRLSLFFSLSLIGPVLIPLVLLGPPRQAGFLIAGLALLSLLLLFIPLWGVHRQIVAAKATTLGHLGAQLMAIQKELQGTSAAPGGTEALRGLAERTELLMELRKHVLGSPNWPFQNLGAALRAVIAAMSPLVYFILNELIQTYFFPVIR